MSFMFTRGIFDYYLFAQDSDSQASIIATQCAEQV